MYMVSSGSLIGIVGSTLHAYAHNGTVTQWSQCFASYCVHKEWNALHW